MHKARECLLNQLAGVLPTWPSIPGWPRANLDNIPCQPTKITKWQMALVCPHPFTSSATRYSAQAFLVKYKRKWIKIQCFTQEKWHWLFFPHQKTPGLGVRTAIDACRASESCHKASQRGFSVITPRPQTPTKYAVYSWGLHSIKHLWTSF